MRVKLIVVEGQARQREVEVELPAWIGRSRAAEVTIGDPKVSRQHCQLYEEDGVLMVRDNDSMNGTWLDGEQVAEAAVEPGAKLTIGPLTLMAVYEPTGELPSAAAPAPAAAGEVDFAALIDGTEDDAEDDAAGMETVSFLPPAADPESFLPAEADAESPEEEDVDEDEEESDAPDIEQAAKPVPRAIEINQDVTVAKPAAEEDPAEFSFDPDEEDDEDEEWDEDEFEEEEEEPEEAPAEPAPAASEDGPVIGPPEDFDADEDEDLDDDALGDFFKGLQ